MKNQPNDIAALGVLRPLFEAQLSQLSNGWQSTTEAIAEQITQFYNTIGLELARTHLANFPPKPLETEILMASHYKQLLVGWRQQTQQLLEDNSNQSKALTSLAKACYYLWQGIDSSNHYHPEIQQRLWYLAELWLRNLANNHTPAPIDYVPLLSRLDELLELDYHYALAQQDSKAIAKTASLETGFMEKLLVDVFINISLLHSLDEPTRELIDQLLAELKIASAAEGGKRDDNHAVRYDDDGEVASIAWENAQAQVKPDIFDMDEEIRQIFIEESTNVSKELKELLPVWQQELQNLLPLAQIHHGFYDLKGSGRLIGAYSISEMAWAVENLLTHILNKSLAVSDDAVYIVTQAIEQLPILIENFSASQAPQFDPALIILQSQNLLAGLPLLHGLQTPQSSNETVEVVAESLAKPLKPKVEQTSSVTLDSIGTIDNIDSFKLDDAAEKIVDSSETLETEASDRASSTIKVPAVLKPFMQKATQIPADTDDADPDIKEIFIEEAYEVLEEIVPLYEQWQAEQSNTAALTDVRRGFHTLKGSGRMVGAFYSAELAWAIESMLNKVLDNSLTPSAGMKKLVADVLAAYPGIIETFAKESQDYPAMVVVWIAVANAYSQQLGAEFSYSSLRSQESTDSIEISDTDSNINDNYAAKIDSETDNASQVNNNQAANHIETTDVRAIDEANSAEDILKTIHSINDMMIETPLVIDEATHEEREIFDIFIEEARDLLQQINEFINTHKNKTQVLVSENIVRAFHTLRAASGTNALTAISKVSTTIEQSLEHLQKHDTPMTAQHLEALTQSVDMITGYLDTYEQSVQQHTSTPTTQSKQDVESLQAMLDSSEESGSTIDNELSIEQLLSLNIDTLLDAEWQLVEKVDALDDQQLQDYIKELKEQVSRLAASTAELPKFTAILSALESAYSYLDSHPKAANDSQILTALLAGHTHLVALFDSLAGGMSFKVDQPLLDDLTATISSYNQLNTDDSEYDIENNLSYHTESDKHQDFEQQELEASSEENSDVNRDLLLSLLEPTESTPTVKSVAVEALQLETVNADTELLEIFLEEAEDLNYAIGKTFNQWRKEVTDVDTLKVLQRHLHTIKGGARMAGISSIGDLTHAAESIYEAFITDQSLATLQWVDVMQTVQDTLSLQLEHVEQYQQSFQTYDLIKQLNHFKQQKELPSVVTLKLPVLKSPIKTKLKSDYNVEYSVESAAMNLETLIAESWPQGLPDADILEVFLEEAKELVESSQKHLQLFLNNTSDMAAVQTLQRDLHTIKGGARMVAANGIADLAHEMESVYEALAIGRRPATKMIAELLVTCHEWLTDAVFVLEHRINPPMPTSLITALQEFSKNNVSSLQVPVESLQTQISAILAVQAKQQTVRGDIDISEMPAMTGSFAESERSIDGNDEMIRISSGLVEHMINLSGESAINRARIDMGMSSLTGSIGEMSITVQRLADQLRRMEIELEAQILSQIDEDLIKSEDFDPLEMDQYSSLNQLSKSLTESASDLIDINNTLLEKTRDNENLLLQLSRTQTELQDGLMNSRMVPFLRLKPRLDLIVRQTANELNKSVDLTIITADDELDRTILERITSPLEHMLRNAVDHGIESPQERMAAGKDRNGHITLEVLREGSEVVIHLSDDGRGIDVNEVRQKAITQGLVDPTEYQYTDLEVMQYVFNAGVTTSKNVTQISGRGVGMDVVASEIRQLGGAVSVSSEAGVGTRVTLRIPLTVAVSDALVVRVADRYYAIPLIQIERVVRVNPEALYDYYHSTQPTMAIEGKDYRVRYLNDLMSGSKFNELMLSTNTNTSLPVIIVKNSSGQNLALQVDQIAGSRIEVVVKPMGQQLSHLAGVSAATIMGDGSVMLILDIIALLRQSTIKTVSANEPAKPDADQDAVERKTTILVVDDSVTVRKVTSRFLERQGLTAVVAKDGVDAMEILQELTPDLMLLDIEMPRMDGFEVATQVRNNQRLQEIPIIMITSRTGDKHRNRAFATGVNDYMGKPFQENELLEKIQALLDIKIDAQQKV